MNIKPLIAAIALAAAGVAQAQSIPTLDTVQVRPTTEQIAQRAYELASPIPTLATVEVRPSAEQQAERAPASEPRVVTLATVQVRPSEEQVAERESVRDSRRTVLAETAGVLATAVRETLPALRPAVDLKALSSALVELAEVR